MTEISSWCGVILICDLRFSEEQLFYWYLPVGVETKTKHPPSSTKLLGTSSPYNLHLKSNLPSPLAFKAQERGLL